MMLDAREDSEKNHETESDEFELEREEWSGVITSRMTNLYRAGGSVSGNQSTFQPETSFRDKPRVERTNIHD